MPDTNLAIVSSSRGCDQACTFCSQQKFWNRSWRARTAENFVDELEMLKRDYGVGVVMLSDETPTIDRARWEKILDLLIERDVGMYLLRETRVDDVIRDEDIIDKYVKAGVHHVYVGVERTDQATLDMFKKDTSVAQGKKALDLLNDADIITETSLILGLPDDTPEIIEETFRLAQHYNPDLGFFLTIAPWPYADNYKELEPYVISYDYEDYNLVAPVIKPKTMTKDALMEQVIDCYKRFYMDKLKDVPNMTPFKQRYYMITMKLLMENSYLTQYLGGMGDMPEDVNEMLKDYIDADEIKAVEAIYSGGDEN
jgi:anaerobic magnesium-protoporphyrin IX monomethyl ester cyclase